MFVWSELRTGAWGGAALFDLAEELNEVIFMSDMTLFIFFFF